jgi:hypothetical protein
MIGGGTGTIFPLVDDAIAVNALVIDIAFTKATFLSTPASFTY